MPGPDPTDPMFIGQRVSGFVGTELSRSPNFPRCGLQTTATVTTIPSATAITASLGDPDITNLPEGLISNINSLTMDYYTHVAA